MPDLNLGPDPSASKLPSVLIAIAVLAAVAVAIYHFSAHSTADITVTKVQLYAAHTTTNAMASDPEKHIMGTAAEANDDLYVLVNIKVTDKLRVPLFIKDETAVLTAPDNSITEISAVEKPDLANIYTVFPALHALSTKPLTRDTQIDPGQSAEGTIVLHIPGAKEDAWRKRQSATLTITYFHQDPQTITVP